MSWNESDSWNMTMEDNRTLSSTSLVPIVLNHQYHHLRLDVNVIVQIALYSVIFLLTIVGNALVILTLVQNQGMRTITNLFLLNLSISDLLMGLFCIPVTLMAGIVLKDFPFGGILCKLIPYLQAVSVSVSAWTLVAISVERYYAICHPLTSRRWQTLSHAYKMIGVVWVLSALAMSPIAILSTLLPVRDTGRHKCREIWPSLMFEKTYTVFLDIILLVLPLLIMTVKYSLIMRTLWPAAPPQSHGEPCDSGRGGSLNEDSPPGGSPGLNVGRVSRTVSSGNHHQRVPSARSVTFHQNFPTRQLSSVADGRKRRQELTPTSSSQYNEDSGEPVLRHSNVGKSLRRKKRVIKMLGAVVIEFFIFWTPVYVMNTWYLFAPEQLYSVISPLGVSIIHLLCYSSCCSNPVTYAFMNRGFRVAFFRVFGCHCGGSRTPRHARETSNFRTESIRLTRNNTINNVLGNKNALNPNNVLRNSPITISITVPIENVVGDGSHNSNSCPHPV